MIITHIFLIAKLLLLKIIKFCRALCYNTFMITAINCPALSTALKKLKTIIAGNEKAGKKTVIFCEDRLTLAAERTVCAAVEGTFLTSVYTLARFLSSECGKRDNVLSGQGSAMVIRKIIEENRADLRLFKRLSSAPAAQNVYDTIALLYSSRISAQDLNCAVTEGLLEEKLHDLAIIYTAYENYLKESGKLDRNVYLRALPPVIEKSRKIKGAEVVFLGFQAFTCSTTECARAAFSAALNVTGLFIGGAEDIYTNGAIAAFTGAAAEFGGCVTENVGSDLSPEAEILRKGLFNPESFYAAAAATDKVHLFEACDLEEEIEFIAASIKKHVFDGGERFGKISVMLPDLKAAEAEIQRVFSRFKIPFYVDRRHTLIEHPLSAFISGYLSCAISGCVRTDVESVISSPYFDCSNLEKDVFKNYLLRLANYRGGVKRAPKPEILQAMNFAFDAVENVRKKFLKGLDFLSSKEGISSISDGVLRLLSYFNVDKKLENAAKNYRDLFPVEAEFSARAYDAAVAVIKEAETLCEGLSLKEFAKILKSGFSAMQISLIPPKADAVFVGQIDETANTGSSIIFAAALSGDVPSASADISLLSDREIDGLARVNLSVSPKIREVNLRRRELAALNLCAFRNRLYLSYSTRSGGDEVSASEIISYATALFKSKNGGAIVPLDLKRLDASHRAVPYYCSETLPAVKQLFNMNLSQGTLSAVYEVLKEAGVNVDGAFDEQDNSRAISNGESLFTVYGSVTPTTLETYFVCPYMNFMRQGLKLQEREEGAVRAVDTGNFIHKILEELAEKTCDIPNEKEMRSRARERAEKLLSEPPYSQLAQSKSGEYTAKRLVDEAETVCAGMYEQLANSGFKVAATELKCTYPLGDVKLFGRVDRVDSCGDMVRIIDYKTGKVEPSAEGYYMGRKLQLPLYLLSASEGKRPVGAYYFPASVEYKDKPDGVFRLQGFMDGSDEVVSNSDKSLQPKQKSRYVDAYYQGRKLDGAMSEEDFSLFLRYSVLVSATGAREMLSGNITPSPAEGACDYCKMGGSCRFKAGETGVERFQKGVKCADIADLVRGGKKDE